MDENIQIDSREFNDFSKKSALQTIIFYVLLFFLGGYFISSIAKYIPNTTKPYTSSEQIINNLQLRYSLSYLAVNEYNKLSADQLEDIDFYLIDEQYYLLTTKDLLSSENITALDIIHFYTVDELFYEKDIEGILIKYKVDRYGLKDNSEFEARFNLLNNAKYNMVFEDSTTFTITTNILINFIVYLIAFTVVVLMAFKILKTDFSNLKKLDGIVKHIALGVLILYLSSFISAIIVNIIKRFTDDNTITSINQFSLIQQLNSKLAIISILNIIIFAPVVEELVFRKAFFSLIKNKWLALVASALLFGLIHVLAETSLLSFIVNFITYSTSGLALGYIYIRSKKNIWIPILVHLISNLISVIFILVL